MGELQATLGAHPGRRSGPSPALVLELLKPVTWFAPVWAFLCGAASSGRIAPDRLLLALAGAVLAGPLVCATSQAVNDWFDRHVDAINEPGRPIPSGRLPGRTGLYIACIGTALALGFAALLGPLAFGACALALLLAWAYSAPPARLKARGWAGPVVVALSYEGLSWFTGAALLRGALPGPAVLATLLLYSFGAAGIMVLNDFKSIEGDRRLGLRSVPAELGAGPAARIACAVMAAPQVLVALLLAESGRGVGAVLVTLALAGQLLLMRRLLADPAGKAAWYNATGTLLFVLGMMASAVSLGMGASA